jgi:hypothetical protein
MTISRNSGRTSAPIHPTGYEGEPDQYPPNVVSPGVEWYPPTDDQRELAAQPIRPASALADLFKQQVEQAEKAIALREHESKEQLERWRKSTAAQLRAMADAIESGKL